MENVALAPPALLLGNVKPFLTSIVRDAPQFDWGTLDRPGGCT